MNDSLVQLFTRFGRTYPAGSTIFLENERGEEMYIILSGKVRISKRVEVRKKVGNTWIREGTEERELAQLSVGDFFGEMSLLNDKPRSARADAVTETKVIVLNRTNFEKILEMQPKLTIKMLKEMSNRVRELDKLVGWHFGAPATEEKKEETKKEEVKEEERKKPEKNREMAAPLPFLSPSPTENLDAFLIQALFPQAVLDSFDLNIFEILKSKEKNLDEILAELKFKKGERVEVLLRLLSGLGLLVHYEGNFVNLPLTTRSFTQEGNAPMGGTLELFKTIFEKGISKEKELLTTGQEALSDQEKDVFVRNFFENAMIRYGEAIDFLFSHSQKNVKKFLEVAPAPGSYVVEVTRNCPAAEGIIFEKPDKVQEAESFLEVFDLKFLITVQTANPFEALFPKNQDLFIFSMQNAIHGKRSLELIEKAQASLSSGGILFIHDFLLEEDKTAPLRVLSTEWIMNLFLGPTFYLTKEEIKEKAKSLKLQYLQESCLPDQSTCIIFQK